MNFFKQFYTQAEIDEEIRKALDLHNSLDPLHGLIFGSDEDVIASVRAAMPLAPPAYVAPRALTPAEETRIDQKIDSQMIVARVWGDRASSDATGIPALDAAWKAKEDDEFKKLIAPSILAKKVAENTIAGMIEKAIEGAVREAFTKGSVPMRESERVPLALGKRASGERIEFDARLNETTLYVGGAYRGFWKGAPSERPHSFA